MRQSSISSDRRPSVSSVRRPLYIPDFSLRTSAPTQVLKITRSHYLAAKRASDMEVSRAKTGVSGFDEQLEKVFNDEWKKTSESENVSPMSLPDMTVTPPETPMLENGGGIANGGFVPTEDAVAVVGGDDEVSDSTGRSRLI